MITAALNQQPLGYWPNTDDHWAPCLMYSHLAGPKSWLRVCFVSGRGLLFKNLRLLWVRSGSAMGLLGSALEVRFKHWSLFFLPPVSPPLAYSKYTCRDVWLSFSSNLRVCFLNRGLPSMSAQGQHGFCLGSYLGPPKQTRSKPWADTENRPEVWLGYAFC